MKNSKIPTSKSTRVLVIGARGIPHVEGGAEKNAEMLFPLLVKSNMEVTLMGLPEFINDGSYRGVNLLKAPHFRFLNTDKIGYYLFALRTVIQTRPHIVHLQGLGSAIFLVAYRLLGSKVVVRYGSADYVLEKWGIIGKIGFLISEFQLRFAHAVISVTPALTDRLRSRGIVGNVYTIPNALDFTKELTNDSRKANLIVAVGRVTYCLLYTSPSPRD